jgi:phenylacetate-coenzyme A ligase PaaK-like adenylate-forming protein
VYLTNLYNSVLPLIRYEITDQVTFLDEPCPCGSQYRRIADIQGRLDDAFTYRGVTVHPNVFRSVLARDPRLVEYQVRQTRTGAEVLLRGSYAVPPEELARALEIELIRVGLSHPVVTVRLVERIDRVGVGKLKRFQGLQGAEPSTYS